MTKIEFVQEFILRRLSASDLPTDEIDRDWAVRDARAAWAAYKEAFKHG